MEGMREKKLYFPLLKSGKRQKSLLGGSVSTHFVADRSFTRILKRVFGGGNGDGGSLGAGGGWQTLASTISKGKALGEFETRFSMGSVKVENILLGFS